LVACAWLLIHGFEVYRNVSQHGFADLVATKGGKIFYIDVKSCIPNSQGRLVYNKKENKGAVYLLISPDGKIEPFPVDSLPVRAEV